MRGFRIFGICIVLLTFVTLVPHVYQMGVCQGWWAGIGSFNRQFLSDGGYCTTLYMACMTTSLGLVSMVMGIMLIVTANRKLAEQAARNRRL